MESRCTHIGDQDIAPVLFIRMGIPDLYPIDTRYIFRHEITSLANADGELPQAAVILQDVLERLLNEIPQISDE